MSYHKGWQDFLKLCSQAEDEKLLSDLLRSLLTPEEISSIETRCMIVKELLEQKKTQREMSKSLSVSISKITRGSNIVKTLSPKIKKYFEQYFFNLSK